MTIASHASQAQPSTVALFISDLHLQEDRPRTNAAFFEFLSKKARHSQALYLLGDIFEYWAGDDDLSGEFNRQVAEALKDLCRAGVQIFWIDGNRDFLAGEGFMREIGATRLPDPYLAEIAGLKLILSHGDAYCVDDRDYMAFREQVRNPAWQKQFLNLPLAQRKAIIAGLRESSRKEQQGKSAIIMDVNPAAISHLIEEHGVPLMIHGHTHRPALHESRTESGLAFQRYVLPDWELDDGHHRGGWLAIREGGIIEAEFFGNQ